MRARECCRLARAAEAQHVRIEKAARAFLVKLKPPIGQDPVRAVGDLDRLRPRGIGRQGQRSAETAVSCINAPGAWPEAWMERACRHSRWKRG